MEAKKNGVELPSRLNPFNLFGLHCIYTNFYYEGDQMQFGQSNQRTNFEKRIDNLYLNSELIWFLFIRIIY